MFSEQLLSTCLVVLGGNARPFIGSTFQPPRGSGDRFYVSLELLIDVESLGTARSRRLHDHVFATACVPAQ